MAWNENVRIILLPYFFYVCARGWLDIIYLNDVLKLVCGEGHIKIKMKNHESD